MKWLPVVGFEGLYEVSESGMIRSLDRWKDNHSTKQFIKGAIKSTRVQNSGYVITDLYKDGKSKTVKVHRVVAQAFIPNYDNKPTVNHEDGNKENNDVSNLKWMTFSEQNEHFYARGFKSESNIKKAVNAMNEANSTKLKCLENGMEFKSQSEASRLLEVPLSTLNQSISKGRKVKSNIGLITLVKQ